MKLGQAQIQHGGDTNDNISFGIQDRCNEGKRPDAKDN